MARAYVKKGEFDTALPYFLDAYRRNNQKQSAFTLYQYPLALGDCYLCLGQLDSAEVYLKEALATPDTGNLSVAHNLLSELYEKRGDWEKALTEAKESRRLFEIKFTADKAKAVADLETRYATAEKEHRIAELEQQHKSTKQKNLIAILIALLVVGLLIALVLRLRSLRRILRQEYLLLEQEKKLAETHALLKTRELERTATDLRKSKETLQLTQVELDNAARSLELKNRLIEELELKLNKNHLPNGNKSRTSSASEDSVYNMKILNEDDWSRFRKEFEQSFPGFLLKLKGQYPKLTAAEMRLFLLLKLDFNIREAADTLGISAESVTRSKYRLRRKLGLKNSRELGLFVLKYE